MASEIKNPSSLKGQGRLYLGSLDDVSLMLNQVHCVLSLTKAINLKPIQKKCRKRGISYHHFEIEDEETESTRMEMRDILPKTYYIITRKLSQGQHVLVHCRMGISRSATVAINWMMRRIAFMHKRKIEFWFPQNDMGVTLLFREQCQDLFEESFMQVYKCRPRINPNREFTKELLHQAVKIVQRYRHESLFRMKNPIQDIELLKQKII